MTNNSLNNQNQVLEQNNQSQKKQHKNSKEIFFAGLFYTFAILTLVAFLFHLFGLEWFASTVKIQEPDPVMQQVIMALLKIFELVFLYKILLAKKGWIFCLLISVAQVGLVGFIPIGILQTIADMGLLILLPILLRHDRGWALLDAVVLITVGSLYAAMMLVAKFGEANSQDRFNFYAGIASLIDYKLFIVTIYMYIKYKGGVKLWKVKRKLFSQE